MSVEDVRVPKHTEDLLVTLNAVLKLRIKIHPSLPDNYLVTDADKSHSAV